MKLLLQVLGVIVLIFVVWLAVATTIGLLIRVAIGFGIAALVVAWVRHLVEERRKSSSFDAKAHRKADKHADRKLKEMEREVNGR